MTRARELCRPADILRHMFLLGTLDEFVANQTPIRITSTSRGTLKSISVSLTRIAYRVDSIWTRGGCVNIA